MGSACYLVDTSEENGAANEAAWQTMAENDEGQALIWFSLLQNADGMTDLSQMAMKTMGVSIDGLADIGEEEFKLAIGAAHRSLLDEGLEQEECDVVTDFLDTNDDGMLSVSERVGGMHGDCDEQASTATVMLCNFYVDLFSKYITQGDVSVEFFCDRLVGIEIPLKDVLEQE